MKPRLHTDVWRLDLFQVQFNRILDLNHPLVVLAEQIDRSQFDEALD